MLLLERINLSWDGERELLTAPGKFTQGRHDLLFGYLNHKTLSWWVDNGFQCG